MPPVGGVPMGMPMGAPVVQGRGCLSRHTSLGEMIYLGNFMVISWWPYFFLMGFMGIYRI